MKNLNELIDEATKHISDEEWDQIAPCYVSEDDLIATINDVGDTWVVDGLNENKHTIISLKSREIILTILEALYDEKTIKVSRNNDG